MFKNMSKYCILKYPYSKLCIFKSCECYMTCKDLEKICDHCEINCKICIFTKKCYKAYKKFKNK